MENKSDSTKPEFQKLLTTVFDSDNSNLSFDSNGRVIHKITERSCLLYLYSHYPDMLHSKEQVQWCKTIFELISKKSNFQEISNGEVHIGYVNTKTVEYSMKEQTIVKHLLFHPFLKIICEEAKIANSIKDTYTMDVILGNHELLIKCFEFWSFKVDEYMKNNNKS